MQDKFNELFQKVAQLAEEVQEYTSQYDAAYSNYGKSIKNDYTSTPTTYGPKAITMEQYKTRTARKVQPVPEVKKKARGGKKYKFQREIKELRGLIPISAAQQKYQFYLQLKELTTKDGKSQFETRNNNK